MKFKFVDVIDRQIYFPMLAPKSRQNQHAVTVYQQLQCSALMEDWVHLNQTGQVCKVMRGFAHTDFLNAHNITNCR